MNTIDKILSWGIVLLVLVPMASCSDDDDTDNGSDIQYRSIVGEWYSDFGMDVEGSMDWGISAIYNDGTTDGFLAHVSKEEGYLIPVEGTYKISGKKYSQAITMFGETETSILDILSIGMYDIRLFNNENQMLDISHRILDTYNLQVGETHDMLINDPDFVVMEYRSDNEKVATISPNGTIEALRVGTAYVSAVSKKGTAVIRVVVTNPVTGIDDFMAYMFENVDVATQAYGTLYKDLEYADGSGYNMRHYYMLDENVEEIGFTFGESKVVEDVRVVFRNGDLLDEIAKTYLGLYELRAEQDDYLLFTTKKYGRGISISIDYETNMLWFMVRGNDPIQALDDLVHMTATEAAEALGHTLTDTERATGHMLIPISNNPIFKGFTMYFDTETDMPTAVYLFCKDGITLEDIEPWYQQNYIATGIESLPYARLTPTSIIYLTFNVDEVDGSVAVIYMIAY